MCPARIQIDRCDILTVRADVCVSSIHRSRDMKIFPLSKQILKKAGSTIQAQLDKTNSDKKELGLGDVEMTDAGSLKNFKKFLFICLLSYVEGNEEFLLQSLIECLELAAVEKHSVVAIPALGTGGLNYPAEKVAMVTIQAVALHNLQHEETTSIKTVNIVLLENDTQLIQTYLRICVAGSTNLNDQNRTGASGSSPTPSAKSAAESGDATNTGRKPNQPSAQQSPQAGLQAGVFSFVSSLFRIGWTQRVGLFQFTVRPSFDGKFVGLSVHAGVDVSFFSSLLSPANQNFFQNLQRQHAK
ncbi:hypothetical protein EGW08_001991 [Elysia chlorotica]|uniref:Macro domain-containing protein n=1 Tax=Elysia chlorotica TaxID=188477 RepID=A0A433U8U3_ELYCH|nr:hypothetical protein EGW08_001991 [Elysia chlorotica]